jgi:hypothetical protein
MRGTFFSMPYNYFPLLLSFQFFQSISVIAKSWSESIVMASSLLLSYSLWDWFTPSSKSFTLLRISAPCLSNGVYWERLDKAPFSWVFLLFQFLLSQIGGNEMPTKTSEYMHILIRNGGFHKSPKEMECDLSASLIVVFYLALALRSNILANNAENSVNDLRV